ncbi:uncharacterized protein LOC132184572 [Corylus avellana]|uniref:uncharacterized protein LOC132184572 n=1 Tax=Corylus avellana TaxID=13451 RepID=UPI00286A63B9|nr:uncharacterized protein LOC132184572 [Corylus avellana]
MFASESKARVMQTRYQLATLKKGASSITDYFHKAQTLAHTLAAINEPLNDFEVVFYILVRLSTDYDPLVTSITTRIAPIFMEELYGHLLTHEQRIELHHTIPDLSSSNVNVALRHSSSFNNNSHGSPHSRGSSHMGRGRGRGDSHGLAAYFAAPHAASDSSWYHDTSSTHHLTNDLSNLNVRAEEYTSNCQIKVGNGQGYQGSEIAPPKPE